MPLTPAITGLLALAQLSAGQVLEVEGIQGFSTTIHHEIRSEKAEHRYDVLVGLPRTYDESGEERYPVVYVLDAGVHYPTLFGYHNYMINSGALPEVIFVGVSYGTNDWREGNNRSHDFTAPTEEREFWGGASDYLDFLAAELMPAIAENYRVNTERQILFGQSLGGQFVLFTAQTRPEVFWAYIASNPALHRNLEFFLEATPEHAPDRRVFVASSENDSPQFRGPAVEWIQHWTGRDALPWQLRAVTLEGQDHFSAPPVSYREGMLWLFEDAQKPVD